MKSPKNPCPYCPLFLLSSYFKEYNTLGCYEGHYKSHWTKEDNLLISETFTIHPYHIHNVYRDHKDIFIKGCSIDEIVQSGPHIIGANIIRLPEPISTPISLEQIKALLIFQ